MAPTQLTESPVWPIASPNGYPALKHFSAAARKKSPVQLSASSLIGAAPAGYILVRSRPTCFEQVDPAAGRQCQAADCGGHRNPVALHLAEILVTRADSAVLRDQCL